MKIVQNKVVVAWASFITLMFLYFIADFCWRSYPANPIFFLITIPALGSAWIGWKAVNEMEK